MLKYEVIVNNETFIVQVRELGADEQVAVTNPAPGLAPVEARKPSSAGGGSAVSAPMAGRILSVKVKEGQTVAAGEVLLILEAMKMENEIVAPRPGRVVGVHVKDQDAVETGQALVSLAGD